MNVPTTRDQWTVLSLATSAREYLTTHGIDEARLTVDLLLAHVLGISRLELYLQYDRPLTSTEITRFKDLLKRRLGHEPLQYILGETEFMGLALKVNPHVLIPRPETELVVEKTLETIKELSEGAPRVLDIGTGSGNIAIAVAHYAPHVVVTALDVSGEALAVAEENVRRHALDNVTLENVDLFSDRLPGPGFDLVVSNPPYVSAEEFRKLEPEVRDFEPPLATTDESDGLRFMRRISAVAESILNPGGAVILELGHGQSDKTREMFGVAGLEKIQVFEDYASIPRVIRGWHSVEGSLRA
jgi:release factor glutamine methyltransferase